MYQSPIVITRQMRTQFEDNVFKAILDYGIVVDKEELLKALQYDRGQYEKGFADGMLVSKDEWISVEERLPETPDRVLVYLNADSTGRSGFIDTDRILNGRWVRWGSNVDYWMALPQPPKMKGGDNDA